MKQRGKSMETKQLGRIANEYRAVIILIVFTLVLGVMNPRFLQMNNVTNILNQTSVNALLAAGLTIVILTGGIDISVGSILGFTGAVAAILLSRGFNVVPVVLLSLLIGVVAGGLNGIFISRWNLQPMIVTLATLSIFRGATYLLTNSSPVSVTSDLFHAIGGGRIFGVVPVPVVIMIVLFAAGHY